ncbi:glycosyltransferase family 4 protein [Patescibacteria group bacterium]
MKKRKIGINASFLRKLNTGIGQVTRNALNDLKNRIEGDSFILYLEDKAGLSLPDNFEEKAFLPFWKRDDLIRKILWEKFSLPKKVTEDNCESFISLYQCPTILGKNIKHTMVVHDIIPKLFPEYLNNWRKKLYWKLTEQAIKRADRIIAVSESTKIDLVEKLKISEEKIEVSHVDVDDIYKAEVSSEKSKEVLDKYDLSPGYIYSGGGLEKRKNIDKVIFAYNELRKSGVRLPKLVISGKMMPELAPLVTDVAGLVKDYELEADVRLLDFVSQEDLPAIYKNALFFVYPSEYEGFGMPVLEAMNQGIPVIAARNSSIAEVGGDAVVYFETENIDEMSRKIEDMVSNEELRVELSKKEKERARMFSWESFVGNLIGEK